MHQPPDDNSYQSSHGQEGESPSPDKASQFTPIATAYCTGLCCMGWFIFALTLNELSPWAAHTIATSAFVLDRSLGLLPYLGGSLVAALVASGIVYAAHAALAKAYPRLQEVGPGIGTILFGSGAVGFIALKLLVA